MKFVTLVQKSTSLHMTALRDIGPIEMAKRILQLPVDTDTFICRLHYSTHMH